MALQKHPRAPHAGQKKITQTLTLVSHYSAIGDAISFQGDLKFGLYQGASTLMEDARNGL